MFISYAKMEKMEKKQLQKQVGCRSNNLTINNDKLSQDPDPNVPT